MNCCKQCKYYIDESYTSTGIGIAYCYMKDSKRYNMPYGSIQSVVYEDGKCRYFQDSGIVNMPGDYLYKI